MPLKSFVGQCRDDRLGLRGEFWLTRRAKLRSQHNNESLISKQLAQFWLTRQENSLIALNVLNCFLSGMNCLHVNDVTFLQSSAHIRQIYVKQQARQNLAINDG